MIKFLMLKIDILIKQINVKVNSIQSKKLVDQVKREKEDLIESYNLQLVKTKADKDRV